MVTPQVHVRDGWGSVVGRLDDYAALDLRLRWQEAGAWSLRVPVTGKHLDLMERGNGIVVSEGDRVVMSGPITEYTITSEGGATPTAEYHGVDDTAVLSDRVVLPNPGAKPTEQTEDAYWQDAGPAEYVIRRLIARQAGAGARPGERGFVSGRCGHAEAGAWTFTGFTGATANLTGTGTASMLSPPFQIGSDMISVDVPVIASGPTDVTVSWWTNTTAGGTATGQPGVHQRDDTLRGMSADSTGQAGPYRVGDVLLTDGGYSWARCRIQWQAKGSPVTVQVAPGSYAWVKTPVGGDVQANFRLTDLGKAVTELAVAGGVGVRIVQDGADRVLEVSAPSDRTRDVVFSQARGNITGWALTDVSPSLTSVIVGGQGQGVARQFVQVEDRDLLTVWGRYAEGFRDGRDTNDPVLLAQRGAELLTEQASASGIRVTPVDVPGSRLGTDYHLGDAVTVEAAGRTWADRVTEARLSGVAVVSLTVGSSDAGSRLPPSLRRQKNLVSRLNLMERS